MQRTGKGKEGARGLDRERVERKAGRKRKGIREGGETPTDVGYSNSTCM